MKMILPEIDLSKGTISFAFLLLALFLNGCSDAETTKPNVVVFSCG